MAIDTITARSRRAVLNGAVGGLLAAVGQALGRPNRVAAHDPDDLSRTGNLVSDEVYIENHVNDKTVFRAESAIPGAGDGIGVLGISYTSFGVIGSAQFGVGVFGSTQGGSTVRGLTGVYGICGTHVAPTARLETGVYGYADRDDRSVGVRGRSKTGDGVVGKSEGVTKSGVWGDNTGGGYGVAGSTGGAETAGVWGSNSGSGTGVLGTSTDGFGVVGRSSSGAASIKGEKTTAGTAIFGDIQDPESSDGAVVAITNGHGPGVRGRNNGDGRGVWGRATGRGEGVYGESTDGRGGRFKGAQAQIRLDPSGAATHPDSGAAGDLFVDASGRLWFCKGGTTWKQLA